MRPVFTLTGFLSLFLIRRILRRGALQIPFVRWALGGWGVAVFAGFCVLGVVLLRQLIRDPALLDPLLRVAGTAIPMWVLAIYTVVRMMFMKSGELLELTFSFPLTNRARALGLMLFETLLVGAGVTIVLGALLAGSLSIGGIDVLDEVITSLVMPTLSSYLLASVYYLAFERLLLRLGLARLRAFVVPVLLAVTLIALYFGVAAQAEPVLFASVGHRDYFAMQLIYSDIAAAYGLPLATVAWLFSSVLLVVVVCALTPKQFEPTRRFAAVPALFGRSEFGAYVSAHIRAIETITVCGIVLAGSYVLFVIGVRVPPFLLIAVTLQGVYAYASTGSLRLSGPRRHGSLRRYILLVAPQLITSAFIAIPVSLMSALTGIAWIEIFEVLAFTVTSTVIMTLAGIMFPPEKGNPFSVVIGVGFVGLTTGALMLGANLLGLPVWVNSSALALLTTAAIVFSIRGMRKVERIERHELAV